jgi:hypothetical protein
VSGIALFAIAIVCIFVILDNLCLLPAQYGYIIIHEGNFKSHMHIMNLFDPWKFATGAENPVLQALQFH